MVELLDAPPCKIHRGDKGSVAVCIYELAQRGRDFPAIFQTLHDNSHPVSLAQVCEELQRSSQIALSVSRRICTIRRRQLSLQCARRLRRITQIGP